MSRRRHVFTTAALVIACACSAHTSGSTSVGESGVPLYPGATPDRQGGVVTTTAQGVRAIAAFTTPDSFEKVVAFYDRRLPPGAKDMSVVSASASIASFETGPRDASGKVTVEASSDKPNETTILITHVTKADSPSAEPSG